MTDVTTIQISRATHKRLARVARKAAHTIGGLADRMISEQLDQREKLAGAPAIPANHAVAQHSSSAA